MGKPKGQSRGLAFLKEARPEAVEHLLKFFGESGRHLEPKTRFLISVVTKVINFSPRGLEQYVKRALKEGASADEILDAILCSYPCAGLTRVVDAIDVILDLGLEEFSELSGAKSASEESAAAGAVSGEWVEIAETSEVPEGERKHVVLEGLDVALFNIGGKYHACENRCPHAGGPLVSGHLNDNLLACPLHLWRFDLTTGACLDVPQSPISVYEIKTDGDKVLLRHP